MVRTISSVEKQAKIFYRYRPVDPKSPVYINDSLILAACKLAEEVNAKAIVGLTESGYTAFKSSAHRPQANIFAFTHNPDILNTLSLVWATKAYFYDKDSSTDETIADIERILKGDGHLQPGDVFISLTSIPIHEKNRTNMLKVNVVK